MNVKIEGIVLKEIRFKETSKILTIFTPYHGKISAIARGVYRPKSKLTGSIQPFSYNNFIMYKGRNFYYINQVDVIDSFYSIREEIHRSLCGAYLLELTDSSILEEEENTKLFKLFKKGLKVLSSLKKDFLKFILSYEIKHISFLGYKPLLSHCAICGNEGFNAFKFGIDIGGIICSKCVHLDSSCEHMDLNMYKGINELLYAPLDKLDDVVISKETVCKLHEIMIKYILQRIDKNGFNSLNTLKLLNDYGEIR